MAYGESNVTCPMTSRNAKWLMLSHMHILLSIHGIEVTTTVASRFAPYRPTTAV